MDTTARAPGQWFGKRLDFGGFGLNVHRHIDECRTAPPFEHDVERQMQDIWKLVDAARLPPALDDRLHHPRKICPVSALQLLQHAASAHVRMNGTSKEQERNRVNVSARDTH